MSLSKRIAANTLIQLVGKAVTLGLSLALVAYLTRQLGVSTYGDYVTVLTFSQLFGIAADLGLNVYVLKRLSTPHKGEDQLMGSALGLRLSSVAVLMLGAAGIAWLLPYPGVVQWAIVAGLVSAALQAVNMIFVTVLQARLEMRFAVTSEIVGRAVVLGGSVWAIVAGYGLLGVIIAQVAGSLANLLLSWAYANRFVRAVGLWQAKGTWPSMLKEALPISVSTILSYAYFKTDIILLSLIPIIGRVNAVETGIYGSAYKVLEVLLLIPAIFLGSVFPVLSDFINRSDQRINQLVTRAAQAMLFMGAAVGWLLFIFAPQIIHLIAGPEFDAAVLPLRILGLATACTFFATVFTYTALAFNRQISLIWVYGSAAIFNIVTNVVLIPHYSYLAAAWTTVVTEIIVLLGSLYVAHQVRPFGLPWGRFIFQIAVLSAGAALVWWLLPQTGVVVGASLFIALVVVLALSFKVVALSDLRSGAKSA